jgi:5-methylcytosine-specific restriction endonuclease McrA
MQKRCCTCSLFKNLINFYKNKSCKDGYAPRCKQCVQEYNIKNKDYINIYRRQQYKKNINNCKKNSQKSHFLHREERLKKQRIYYQNNKEYFKYKNKKYRESNKDYILLKNKKRKKLIQIENISQSEIDNLLNNNNNQCFYCKIFVKRGINLHLDHKVPLNRGGNHHINNLVPSCASCNLRKGTKTAEEFLSIMENAKPHSIGE